MSTMDDARAEERWFRGIDDPDHDESQVSDDVKPYTREELEALADEWERLGMTGRAFAAPGLLIPRLLATCLAGVDDRERVLDILAGDAGGTPYGDRVVAAWRLLTGGSALTLRRNALEAE